MELFTAILLEESFATEFKRIQEGEELSIQNIPYTSDYLDMMREYFEYEEEYEKCQIVTNYKLRKMLHGSNFI